MKIYLYKNFVDYPEGKERPFKTVGSAMKIVEVTGRRPEDIIKRIGNSARTTLAPKLVLIKDSDGYENALVGNADQIIKFVRDVLVDAGYMNIKWGKRI